MCRNEYSRYLVSVLPISILISLLSKKSKAPNSPDLRGLYSHPIPQ